MIKQLLVSINEKSFPQNPTPENLYFYSYSRAQRRKHSKAEKEKLLKTVWHNYLKWKQNHDKEVENERVRQIHTEQASIPEDQGAEQSGAQDTCDSNT